MRALVRACSCACVLLCVLLCVRALVRALVGALVRTLVRACETCGASSSAEKVCARDMCACARRVASAHMHAMLSGVSACNSIMKYATHIQIRLPVTTSSPMSVQREEKINTDFTPSEDFTLLDELECRPFPGLTDVG